VGIRLVISDIDGSQTDGSVTYHSDGTTSRTFSTFDGEGFAILKRNGIAVLLMTQSDSPEIKARADWLGVPILSGVKDKKHAVQYVLDNSEIPINPDEVCYFGNDINDLEAMKLVGLPACPADAHWSVLEYVEENGWVTSETGGRGAFRRLVDVIILSWHSNNKSSAIGSGSN
jgi:YrbI family 3-deoxy-D-manno-octulosonate 8-phosphate phosphatase